MPKVAVIIPTCNRSAYLKRAIESVCAQTYTDYEVIVVDDASTDDTAEVVAQFRDKPIKYIRHAENKGGSAARNTGITHSQSEYIAFLDDDDEWLPEKLARQVAVLDCGDKSVGGVCTGHFKVDDKSGAIIGEWIPLQKENLSKEILKSNCLSTTSSLLFKRKVFEMVGLFDEKLKSFQDYDMWLRIAATYEFIALDGPLVNYYLHGQKIWTNCDMLFDGILHMYKKYQGSPKMKPFFSKHLIGVASRYFSLGDFQKGQKALAKAIAIDPWKLKAYIYYLSSLVGPRVFKRLMKVKRGQAV